MNPALLTTAPLIILAVLTNVMGQLLLKKGMLKIGHFEFVWSNFNSVFSQIIVNPYLFLGALSYFFGMLIWLLVLSRVDVSIAYPMTSLGYIVSLLFAIALLQETVSLSRFLAVLTITAGVFWLSRT